MGSTTVRWQTGEGNRLGLLRFVEFDVFALTVSIAGSKCRISLFIIIHPHLQFAVLIRIF